MEFAFFFGLPSLYKCCCLSEKKFFIPFSQTGNTDVLKLLAENIAANPPPTSTPLPRVRQLAWGSVDPLRTLGLKMHPDLVIASDVVYGNDPTKWQALVSTLCQLCGPNTLIVIANVRRYPLHHPMAESKFFEDATALDFKRSEAPLTTLHPDFRRAGAGGCAVHLFVQRSKATKRLRDGDFEVLNGSNQLQ